MSDYIRNGISAVRPYVYGPHSLLEFVVGALQGKVLARHEQGGNALHIEVQVDDSIIVLELCDPPHKTGFPGSIYVYVEDVDAVSRLAEKYDVDVFSSPEDKPYEERQAGIRDSYGNVWWVSTYKPNPNV
jgi:PhnB protein